MDSPITSDVPAIKVVMTKKELRTALEDTNNRIKQLQDSLKMKEQECELLSVQLSNCSKECERLKAALRLAQINYIRLVKINKRLKNDCEKMARTHAALEKQLKLAKKNKYTQARTQQKHTRKLQDLAGELASSALSNAKMIHKMSSALMRMEHRISSDLLEE